MHRVTELFPGLGHLSRVWVTDAARTDYEDVPEPVKIIFKATAAKGFFGRHMHNEGKGFLGFAVGNGTDRITGWFDHPITRAEFFVGGAWSGKSGSSKRPKSAKRVMKRLEAMKSEGVCFPNGQSNPPPRTKAQ